MKKWNHKIVVLFVAFCLLGSALAVNAAEEPARATFTNARNDRPDLYVTKQVESAEPQYPAPKDAVFSFVLKLDQKVASNVSYRVFEESGAEVYNYQEGPSTESKPNKLPFRTSRSGDFTLQAGWTALFEYVGAGKAYEITEQEQEGFLQVSPAQGTSAVGTIPSEGTRVTFTNLYLPKTQGRTTDLTVTKSIAFPEGYAYPEEVSFGYTLKVNGTAYGNESYQIREDASREIIGEGQTDGEGHFTLAAGCTAIFEEVPAGVDYAITEEKQEGWRVVGDATQEGATQAPVTAIRYTNAIASFGVKKTVTQGEAGEDPFSFLLLKEDKKAFAGARYFLYDAQGNRVGEEVYETDEKGNFTLHAGQTALFIGIEPGTAYHVSETAQAGYIQKVPENAQGYENKIVADTVEVLPFENTPVEGGALSVTKVVENATQEAAHAEAEFTFILSRKAGQGETYEPVEGAVYHIALGSGTATYETGPEGEFTLKANETALFQDLGKGETYRVEEKQTNGEYRIDREENRIQEGTLEESLEFTFKNLYTSKLADIKLVKAQRPEGGEEADTFLPGAVFGLYMDENLQNQIGTDYETDEKGAVYIRDLKAGIYYLKEKQAPEGYQLKANPIEIEILREEESQELEVKIDGQEGTWESSQSRNDTIYLTIYNDKSFRLPLTGGGGILGGTGAALLGVVLLFLFIKRKTKKI